jgi:hypothetical protein
LELFRGILVSSYTENLSTWSGKEADFILKFKALGLSVTQLEVIIDGLESAMGHIERNARAPLVLTDLSYTIARNMKKL